MVIERSSRSAFLMRAIILGWFVAATFDAVAAEKPRESAVRHDGAKRAAADEEVAECRYEYPESRPNQASHESKEGPANSAAMRDRDYQCLLPVQAAIHQWKENKRLIIDIRPTEQWDAAQVAGSLNIPAGEIHTKAFLRNKSIALVDKGEDLYAMVTLCASLKDAGFVDVKVVPGGLSAWRWAGPVQGSAGGLSSLSEISAKEFFAARQGNVWILVAMGFDPGEYADDFGGVRTLKYEGAIDPVVDAVRSEGAALVAGDDVSVLFVSRGGRYDLPENTLKALGHVSRVYFLEHGLPDYLEYAQTRRDMIARMNQAPKAVKRCGR